MFLPDKSTEADEFIGNTAAVINKSNARIKDMYLERLKIIVLSYINAV